jgi:hypothetical protein
MASPDQTTAVPAPRRGAECPATPQTVRLIQYIASAGKRARMLMTNRLDGAAVPAPESGDLHHQRWRIEEALKTT